MKTRLLCFLMVLALLPCLALAEDAPQKLVVAEPVHLIGYLPCMSRFTRAILRMKGWT